jgi:dihydrofolate synthase/folylpolyglutamate synthase
MPHLLPVGLEQRRPGRIRPQLGTFLRVLAEVGDPQRRFPSILVVGTNGKGSTAAMLSAVLTANGVATGLYTSPHLVRVEERIRIGGEPLAASDLARHLERLDRFADLTFFEAVTAVAFLAFAEAGVECAVLEAGMGGRWDATRAADSAVAGLTNVGSDHSGWLGKRVEERARDKGEALAAARLAVLSDQVGPELVPALEAPHARAARDLVAVDPRGWRSARAVWGETTADLELPLTGVHQLSNLQLALALALCAVEQGWIDWLDPAAVRTGIRDLAWPGRLSTHRVLGRRVLVDCAHNAEGAEALARHLASQPVLYHLLFSCLEDKPAERMAHALRPHVGNVAVCQIDDERAAPMELLNSAFPEADCAASVEEAIELLPSPVVVAGSVRLVGELLAHGDEEWPT